MWKRTKSNVAKRCLPHSLIKLIMINYCQIMEVVLESRHNAGSKLVTASSRNSQTGMCKRTHKVIKACEILKL